MVDTAKLKELKDLLDSGALTQEEFDQAKKEVLEQPEPVAAAAVGVEIVSTTKPIEPVPAVPPGQSGMIDKTVTIHKPEADSRFGICMKMVGTNLIIDSFADGSASAKSDLEVNDVLKKINGECVADDKEAVEKLKAAPVGDVTFEVSRVYRAPRVPPPGAPPGGEWKNEKYCGCISCLACMVCGCLVLLCGPYDERTVYVLTDGKKYKEDGTRIDTY